MLVRFVSRPAMTISSQLIGNACGHHGPCTFYRTLGIAAKNGQKESISVGQFFFLRFGATEPVCVGELQLLWKDKNVNCALSSCRLYYLPENTPDGRHEHHGEDEVLAVSDKIVLRVEDLVQWIVSDVQWERGLKGCYTGDSQAPDPNLRNTDADTDYEAKDCCDKVVKAEPSLEPSSQGLVETFIDNNLDSSEKSCLLEEQRSPQPTKDCEGSTVKILSYASYCRYRGVLKRLENVTDTWLRNALVEALGGFTVLSRNCRLHFCRETFDHPLLDGNALLLNHLAPSLRGRPRKKRLSTQPSSSLSSESNENESEEWGEGSVKESKLTNGIKDLAGEDLEEQEFLQRLFKFMRQRNTPIERVPHLGFKQINLYFFYTYTQKLGGYDKITIKRMWKHIYDEMGGNPGSTSAATCTRRHYERYLKGEDATRSRLTINKAINSTSLNNAPQSSSPMQTNSNSVDPNSSASDQCSDQKTDMEPVRTMCSKKSIEQDVLPATPSPCSSPLLMPPSPSCSASKELEPSTAEVIPSVIVPPKLLLVLPKVQEGQLEDEDLVDRKSAVQTLSAFGNFPLEQGSLQYFNNQQRKRAKDERFAEKERMWDEIRRQNAVERDRIRQLTAAARSVGSRGVKAKDMLLDTQPGNPRPHLSANGISNAMMPTVANVQQPATFLAAAPKRKKLEEDEAHAGFLHSKALPTRLLELESCQIKQEAPTVWRTSSNAMHRPSVIQHTHSAAVRPPPYNGIDTNGRPSSRSQLQEKHNSGIVTHGHFGKAIPAAHSYSQIPHRPHSADTSKETATSRDTRLGLLSLPESDRTQPMPQPDPQDAVLDLRIKKHAPSAQNGHKEPCLREWRPGPDDRHRRQVLLDNAPRNSESPPEDLSAKVELKCHPVPDRALSNIANVFPLQGGREPAHHMMPSQYFITNDKTPVFLADYGHLLPPHYYGVTFPMPYPSFAFSSNICPTSYKESTPYIYLPKGT